MRIHPWITFLVILVVLVLASWIAAPGYNLNIADIKTRTDTKLGLDLRGGFRAVLQARPGAGQVVDKDVLSGLRDTIERRVNGLGVSEPNVQTQGDDKIVVELPGVTDTTEAVAVLSQTALLEFVGAPMPLQAGEIVTTSRGGPEAVGLNPDGSPKSSGATPGAASPTAAPAMPDATGMATAPTGPVYETVITGAELSDAFPQTDQTGQLVVGFKLSGDAANRFGEYTQAHIGQYLAIVVDKRVISSPRLNGRIDANGQIEGLSRTEVQSLVVQLKSGRLAVPLDLIQTQAVGPDAGAGLDQQEHHRRDHRLASVAFFMIFFYRLPGVLAVVALSIYSIITFALFKLFGIVLTLAGIAGFILSIGMAVDANVLIFARMKEELRAGRNLRNAIDAGFDHAWPSIRDSNASTIITCLILYVFGGITGTTVVRGFSLTLLIGVIVSLFSAITVTRTLLRLLLSSRALTRNRWLFNAETLAHEAERRHTTAVAGD